MPTLKKRLLISELFILTKTEIGRKLNFAIASRVLLTTYLLICKYIIVLSVTYTKIFIYSVI